MAVMLVVVVKPKGGSLVRPLVRPCQNETVQVISTPWTVF